MVDIDSKRLKLTFCKKLAKSAYQFLRYLMFFLGNLQKPVFRVFDPFLVSIDLQNLFEELRFSIYFRTSGRRAHAKHFLPSYCDFNFARLLIKSIKSMRFCHVTMTKFLAGKKFLVENFFFSYFCLKNVKNRSKTSYDPKKIFSRLSP